jgi:phage tail-like protein
MADEKKEPFGAYHFTVEFDGTKGISYPFRSCSGLKMESSVVELEEGGFNTTTRKLIGRTKFPNIVLKRGFCSPGSELYELRLEFMNDLGKPAAYRANAPSVKKGRQTPRRFSGVITAIGPSGTKAKWRFVSGWVCKWEGPDLDASKNEIAIETIEIAHEGLFMMPDENQQKKS